jgi:hypothetical protein
MIRIFWKFQIVLSGESGRIPRDGGNCLQAIHSVRVQGGSGTFLMPVNVAGSELPTLITNFYGCVVLQ